MSDWYSYRAFTKDFIVNNVALKIADVVDSKEVFTDVRAKLAEMPKNELIEKFADILESSWDKNKYSFKDKEIYQYAIDEKFITPHDMAISDDCFIKEWCAILGYEHELLAKDENCNVRSTVLLNTEDPYILSILWEHALPFDEHYRYAKTGSKEEIMEWRNYGIDAGLKNGNILSVGVCTEKLARSLNNEGEPKYRTFQEFFEAHPEMCVLPENRKGFSDEINKSHELSKEEVGKEKRDSGRNNHSVGDSRNAMAAEASFECRDGGEASERENEER